MKHRALPDSVQYMGEDGIIVNYTIQNVHLQGDLVNEMVNEI